MSEYALHTRIICAVQQVRTLYTNSYIDEVTDQFGSNNRNNCHESKDFIMSTITIRIPDTKHARLKTYAQEQNVSLNKLFEEWATQALAQQDAQASVAPHPK